MREIKFRAWHKKYKAMVQPSDDTFMALSGQLYNNGINITDRFELMQYTGLKDKNGKEIYEGDIVKVIKKSFGGIEYYIKSKIIWGQKGGWHPEGTTCDNLSQFLCDISGKNKSEIIGNIYENPKLINN